MENKESFLKRFLGETGQTFFGKNGKNLPESMIKNKKGQKITTGVEVFLKHGHDPAIKSNDERSW